MSTKRKIEGDRMGRKFETAEQRAAFEAQQAAADIQCQKAEAFDWLEKEWLYDLVFIHRYGRKSTETLLDTVQNAMAKEARNG